MNCLLKALAMSLGLMCVPVRSRFRHRHVSQVLSYPFADSSLQSTILKRNILCPLISSDVASYGV